jgi:hypothetical protein
MEIRKFNKQCYKDILADMLKRKNGQFQFTLRIDSGNIVDYVTVEYIAIKSHGLTKPKRTPSIFADIGT